MAMTTIADAGLQPRKTRSLTALFRALQNRFGTSTRAHRDLSSLSRANDHILADLGLTRSQMARASNTSPAFAAYDQTASLARVYYRHI